MRTFGLLLVSVFLIVTAEAKAESLKTVDAGGKGASSTTSGVALGGGAGSAGPGTAAGAALGLQGLTPEMEAQLKKTLEQLQKNQKMELETIKELEKEIQ